MTGFCENKVDWCGNSFTYTIWSVKKQAVREAATICPRPCDLDLWPFDLKCGVRVWRGLPLCQFYSS